MSKRSNLDIKDTACLHIVPNMQHPTSRPTTKSMQTTKVNALKNNFSPLAAGKYGKWTKRSTKRRYEANEGKSGLEAERVRALGALCSLQSKKKLVAEKRQQTHFLSNKEKEKWIEDYVESETTGARKRVEDAEAAIRQDQEHTEPAEDTWLTTTEPKETFHTMIVAIQHSLNDIASSDYREDGEDEDDENTEQGQLSKDDEPGWVMGTINKMVQLRIERFQQTQLKVNELIQSAWQYAANYFHELIRCTALPNWGFQ